MTVWLAQCLCPDRHAIMAAADEAENETDAQRILLVLRETIADLLHSGTLNPWCGICRAPNSSWHYEIGRSTFATIAEARPWLKQTEAANRAAAAVLGDGDPGPLERIINEHHRT